jgi:hypothetical protein
VSPSLVCAYIGATVADANARRAQIIIFLYIEIIGIIKRFIYTAKLPIILCLHNTQNLVNFSKSEGPDFVLTNQK